MIGHIEFGKLSPLNVECNDRKPIIEEFVNDEEKKLLFKVSNSEEKFTDEERKKLDYLDKKLDIPLIEAVLNPSYNALKRLIDNECKNIHMKKYTNHLYIAAEKGHLEILKWCKENDYYWDERTCAYAARGGHLEVLKWARENNCPWDVWTCYYAAENGHLEVLKWARENGCDWDEWTCAFAAKGGHLNILKWARENGCPWDDKTHIYALINNHFEISKWAKENGCPMNGVIRYDPRSRWFHNNRITEMNLLISQRIEFYNIRLAEKYVKKMNIKK